MTAPEFSRPVRLDTLGAAPRTIAFTADESERAALAQRFALVSIDALSGQAEVWRDAAGPMATLTLSARIVQSCVASGVPVPATIAAVTRLRFLPADQEIAGDEIELDEEACDAVFFDGGAIDLGEAAAETLALEMDPFPRSPDAASALARAGVIGEDEAAAIAEAAGPFGGLKALRDKLSGGG